MSNIYEKKFDCGTLGFDLPYSNIMYEVPILNFGDLRSQFNLSIIFNKNYI